MHARASEFNCTILTRENTHKSPNKELCTTHSQRDPGDFTAYPQTSFLHLRAARLVIQPVPVKFRSRKPLLGDFAPPSSPQRWSIFSPGLPTRKASGRFFHILCIWYLLALCVGIPGENILRISWLCYNGI